MVSEASGPLVPLLPIAAVDGGPPPASADFTSPRRWRLNFNKAKNILSRPMAEPMSDPMPQTIRSISTRERGEPKLGTTIACPSFRGWK
jgi:hypothetical protein